MNEDKKTAAGQPTASATPVKANPKRPPARRTVLLTVVGLALVYAFYHGLAYTVKTLTHEITDDAALESDVVAVAPRVAGQVKAVHVLDNQPVRRGDALVEIDPRDYEVRVAQKHAATAVSDASLEAARAGLELVKARLETAAATERQEHANTDAARAKAQRAQADYKRSQSLRDTSVVSPEEFDRARAEAESADADLRAAEQKANAATSQVAEARAQVGLATTLVGESLTRTKQARTDQEAADLDLSYTHIVAPCDGRVTRKAVEPGNYVQVGQALFALVQTDVWVVANFKETQLAHMQTNQPVEIEIDAYPGSTFHGHVDSIMAGSGARFSLLPPENAVGNFVKVVQRVPVKIVFDRAVAGPEPMMTLGPGMSVVPAVRTGSFTVSSPVLWIGAVVLAVLATLGLARVIAHLRDRD
jgi:membrane fusion protein (multidrug efflux system)